METVACNLCGSGKWELFQTVSVEQFGPPSQFKLVKCQDCGLVYLNPRPSPEQMKDYYPAAYYEDLASINKDLYRWYQQERLHKLQAHSKGGRLLDVGCNDGLFLYLAAQAGWEAKGVEMAESSAAYAREVLKLDVFTGQLTEVNFPAQHFDIVTFWHVLEHLHDPLRELREANRIMKPDGLLVVEVPNIASWQARLFSTNWRALDVPRHLYHFSPASLPAVLAAAGFTCFKTSYWSRGHNMASWDEQSRNLILHLMPESASELQSPTVFGEGVPRYLRRSLFLAFHWNAFFVERLAVLLRRGGILNAFARKQESTEIFGASRMQ